MGGKIVARGQGGASGGQVLQDRFQFRPIDGSGMVEIDAGAPGGMAARAIAIEIIQRQAGGFASEGLMQHLSQKGLSRPAASDNGNQFWLPLALLCSVCSHSTPPCKRA